MNPCESHQQCISQALHQAEDICREHEVRFTALRSRVLQLVWLDHGSAKAYDILDKLDGGGGKVRPPTVYRALDFLQQHGLVHKLSSLNAYVGCSHPLRHERCFFLICSSCRYITECCNNRLAEVISGTAARNHFQAHNMVVEIEGECRRCSGSQPLTL